MWHGGDFTGTFALMTMLPDRGVGVAVSKRAAEMVEFRDRRRPRSRRATDRSAAHGRHCGWRELISPDEVVTTAGILSH